MRPHCLEWQNVTWQNSNNILPPRQNSSAPAVYVLIMRQCRTVSVSAHGDPITGPDRTFKHYVGWMSHASSCFSPLYTITKNIPALSLTGSQQWVNHMTQRQGCGRFVQTSDKVSVYLQSFILIPFCMGRIGKKHLPINIDYTDSLDAFTGYYVNHFADHHSHEIIF